MGILKCKIEDHIKKNNYINDLQTGATKGRRVTENIFILQYCIDKTFKDKKKLYMISIDYSKAFDSVNRSKMIEVLEEFRIHPKIIDVIAKIYNKDSTQMFMNNKKYVEIEISSGIRQGCNASALLFILIIYQIMEEIENLGFGYKDKNFKISSLFYMDDGIIMARSKNEVENLINKIETISLKYGLTLNHSKCSIMAVNEKDADDNIGNIEVVKQIKYLGVIVENKRKMFQGHKMKSFDKGIQFGNQLYSILGNSYNRMLIGKTFYKGLVLPNILYGQDIIIYNKSELEQLQKFYNKACRTILNVPKSTAVEFLRDMKNKIMFLKHALKNDSNTILTSLQNVADSTDAVGWSPILPSERSVCIGQWCGRASATSVGQQRKY